MADHASKSTALASAKELEEEYQRLTAEHGALTQELEALRIDHERSSCGLHELALAHRVLSEEQLAGALAAKAAAAELSSLAIRVEYLTHERDRLHVRLQQQATRTATKPFAAAADGECGVAAAGDAGAGVGVGAEPPSEELEQELAKLSFELRELSGLHESLTAIHMASTSQRAVAEAQQNKLAQACSSLTDQCDDITGCFTALTQAHAALSEQHEQLTGRFQQCAAELKATALTHSATAGTLDALTERYAQLYAQVRKARQKGCCRGYTFAGHRFPPPTR